MKDLIDKVESFLKPGEELTIFHHQLSSPGKETWEVGLNKPGYKSEMNQTDYVCRTSLRAALEEICRYEPANSNEDK